MGEHEEATFQNFTLKHCKNIMTHPPTPARQSADAYRVA